MNCFGPQHHNKQKVQRMHHFLGSTYMKYGYVAMPNFKTNYVHHMLMLLCRKNFEASAVNISCRTERWIHRRPQDCYSFSKVWMATLRFIATKKYSSTIAVRCSARLVSNKIFAFDCRFAGRIS
jgi:hypothetical protein